MIDFDTTLIMRDDLPLFGKRILFTTPRNYAGKLARLLVLRGALPIWMPTVVIEPMKDYTLFDGAIQNISSYDWLAFTSRNGIEAFFDRLESLGLTQDVLGKTKLCALGNDAAALEGRGINADLLPRVPTTRALVDGLADLGAGGGRILLPVPEVVGMDEPGVIPNLVTWLGEIGMIVDRVPAYTTTRVSTGFAPELSMLLEAHIDVVAFTSAAEIESLLFLLGENRDILARTLVACYGPVTAGGAAERDVSVQIVSEQFSVFEGFIEAMEQYFS